jgi:hypothetical protein
MGMHRTGLIEFRDGEDNYQKDLFSHPDGSGRTTGSLVRENASFAMQLMKNDYLPRQDRDK